VLKNVVVSAHASRRAEEREIPEEWIKAAINEPQEAALNLVEKLLLRNSVITTSL